jgi:hypothetical protein
MYILAKTMPELNVSSFHGTGEASIRRVGKRVLSSGKIFSTSWKNIT